MEITETKITELNFQTKVVIPFNDIDAQIQKEFAALSARVKVPGFRTGKVPLDIISKKYGESVRSDILKSEINKAINKIIKDNDLNVAAEPVIEDFEAADKKDINFILKIECIPKIDIPEFKDINVEKPVIQVKDKEIKDRLNDIADLSKEYKIESQNSAEKGDQVTIDAIGYVDDVAFEGGALTDHKLVLGSKSFIDNFEDQLVGAKIGDEITVNVTFPKKYHAPNLAGKPAKFIVQMKAIHKAEPVKIDDEFAKKFNCDNVEKLREQISNDLTSEFFESVHTLMKMSLFDQLEQKLTFEVPPSLMDKEYKILQAQGKQAEEADPTLKDKSADELNNYYKKLALRRVRIGLMLADYIQLHNLRIEPNDLKNAVMAQARNFPGQEKLIYEYYQKNQDALKSLEGPILEEKAVRRIFDNEVNITEKSYTREQFKKYIEEENNREIL